MISEQAIDLMLRSKYSDPKYIESLYNGMKSKSMIKRDVRDDTPTKLKNTFNKQFTSNNTQKGK